MARERKALDVSQVPEVLRIVEAMRGSGDGVVLMRDGVELAVLTPADVKQPRWRRKSGVIRKDDALWNIVGLASQADDPATDVSEKKYTYLVDAFADTHE